jgi:HSP20 family protein
MTKLSRREARHIEPADLFGRFDRMFDDWMHEFPVRWPMLAGRGFMPTDMIPIDEYQDDGTLVVRAELPGIDPETDVELTVAEGTLRIEAERREEESVKEKGYVRHEVRCGSFARTVPLPEGVTEADITASYKDGILEIRIPAPEVEPAKKIPIAKS